MVRDENLKEERKTRKDEKQKVGGRFTTVGVEPKIEVREE